MCTCHGGRRSLTVTFEMGPSDWLPLTEENLKQVTSIGYNLERNTLALMINHLPDEGGPDKYEVIDLKPEPPGDLPDVGSGGRKIVQMFLEALTGQPFVAAGPDDGPMRILARKDFKDQVDALDSKKE